jgi:hypothetical protein
LLNIFRVLASEVFGKVGLLGLGLVAIATSAMTLVAWAGSAAGAHWALWIIAAPVVYALAIVLLRVVTRIYVEVALDSF